MPHTPTTVLILEGISKHKALAPLPFPDEVIQWSLIKFENVTKRAEYTPEGYNIERIRIYSNIWTNVFCRSNPEVFECRLVPLNKAHPKVPQPHQMRPIVITNPIYKIMESKFTDEFHDAFWKLQNFAKSQFGFLRGMTCAFQMHRMFDRVTENYDKHPSEQKWIHRPDTPSRTYILFIDFEQAVNSINMWKLYTHMKNDIQSDILNIKMEHLDFVFTMIRRLKIHIGKEIFTPNHGVPQGGILSPIIFNYAMYYYLTEVFNAYNRTPDLQEYQKIRHRGLWADDMAVVLNAIERSTFLFKASFATLIRLLTDIGQDWGLRINWSKSGLMRMFHNFRSSAPASELHYSQYRHLSN